MTKETIAWLAQFDNPQAALEEREIYHAENGYLEELDFNREDDPVYNELSMLVEEQTTKNPT